MVVEFVARTMLQKDDDDDTVQQRPQKRVKKFWIITHGQTYKQQNTEKTAALKVCANDEEVQSMMTTQERVKEDKILATHDII